MDVTLLNKNILVLPEEKISKTSTGIIIPDSETETTQIGVVQKIGDEVSKIEEGHKVAYNRNIGLVVHLDDTEYRVLKEEDILLIVNDLPL